MFMYIVTWCMQAYADLHVVGLNVLLPFILAMAIANQKALATLATARI